MHVSWSQYQEEIHLDLSDASAYCWAWRNISSIKNLCIESATEQQLECLLRDAKVLTAVEIEDSSITAFPHLPQQLQHLYLRYCEPMTQLLEVPATLETLVCPDCCNLQQLPPLQQTALARITVSGCLLLKSLGHLPDALRHLDCSLCDELTHLPDLPEGLQVLRADGCCSLEVIFC